MTLKGDGLFSEAGWVELLKSYAVLDPVVTQARLFITVSEEHRPLFRGFALAERFVPGWYTLETSEDGRSWTLVTEGGIEVGTGSAGDSVGVGLGFLWAPPAGRLPEGGEVRFRVVNPRDASRQLSAQLQASLEALIKPRRLTDEERTALDAAAPACCAIARRLHGLPHARPTTSPTVRKADGAGEQALPQDLDGEVARPRVVQRLARLDDEEAVTLEGHVEHVARGLQVALCLQRVHRGDRHAESDLDGVRATEAGVRPAGAAAKPAASVR